MDLFMRYDGVFPSKKQQQLDKVKDMTSEMTLERAARSRRSVLDCTQTVIKGHPYLLNHTMLILFRTTNIYYMRAVDHTLDLLGTWFACVSPNSAPAKEGRLEYSTVTADDLDERGGAEVINLKVSQETSILHNISVNK